MNANLDNIAKELYGKIQTRFPDIQMGDENAKVLSKKEDIPKARFFEFEYTENGEPLGTVAITLDEDDGIVVQVSGGLVSGQDKRPHHNAFKFIRSFRSFAKDRLLNFDIQNLGKSNLDKRDYHFQAKRKEEPQMEPIMENKLYGTARISYQDLGEAQLIIKHTQPVNPELPASRTQHIENIYIENAVGERFRYPVKHINGARALAEHIKHGGHPYDAIGRHITSMSEELAGLRKFKNYVSRQDQLSEAMSNVTDRVLDRIDYIKKEVQMLQRPGYYESFAESFEEQEEQMLPETVVNDLIDRLTIRTFNEDLKDVFPFIYKFIDESELPIIEMDADDLLGEEHGPKKVDIPAVQRKKSGAPDWNVTHADLEKDKERTATTPQGLAKRKKETGIDEIQDPELAFESSIESLMEPDDLFSPNKSAQQSAIEKFNDTMGQELTPGPGGETPPEVAPPGGAVPTAPGAEQLPPLGETFGEPDDHPHKFSPVEETGLVRALKKACACGASLDEELDFGYTKKTIRQCIEDCGMTPADVGYEEEDNGLEGMLKFISGFYNKEEGNFPLGGTRIKIKVQKEFEEGKFGNASEEDLAKVMHFIEKKDPSSNEQHHVLKLSGAKAPDQTVKFKGGEMNPAEIMKMLMQKINQGR